MEYFDAENNSICLSAGNFENVAQMKSLNLRKNSVKHFYYDLGKACNLIFLDCSSNNLEYLPPEIGLLVQLQTLKLYGNCLRIIPNELGSCHILQHLDLANNYISGSLPESFGLLSNLEVLVIAFNEIEEIPRSVVGLQQVIISKIY